MTTQLTFQCPQCNQGLTAKDDHAGNPCDCPQCATMLIVPWKQGDAPLVVAEDIDDFEPRQVAHHRHYRQNDVKPVKMRLGDLAEMDVEVDQPTRNAMATTFLGGLLVALGAIVMFMLGGKGKSA